MVAHNAFKQILPVNDTKKALHEMKKKSSTERKKQKPIATRECPNNVSQFLLYVILRINFSAQNPALTLLSGATGCKLNTELNLLSLQCQILSCRRLSRAY